MSVRAAFVVSKLSLEELMSFLAKFVSPPFRILATLTILPLVLSACGSPRSHPATDSQLEWAPGVNVAIDPMAITKEIRQAVEGPQKRDSYIKGLCESSFYAVNGAAYKQKVSPYNIMVFNMGLAYKQELRGVQYMQTFTYDGTTYGVWAFEDGAFENKGDGGYSNWCMMGWHDHQEGQGAKRVNFTRPAGLFRP